MSSEDKYLIDSSVKGSSMSEQSMSGKLGVLSGLEEEVEKEGLNFPTCHNIQKHRKTGCCSVSAKTRIHPIPTTVHT